MDEIDRLFRLLVETIRSQEPELLSRPFEVADLYQSLLPYRLHRRELALETNSDYEMALLRLLSNELTSENITIAQVTIAHTLVGEHGAGFRLTIPAHCSIKVDRLKLSCLQAGR